MHISSGIPLFGNVSEEQISKGLEQRPEKCSVFDNLYVLGIMPGASTRVMIIPITFMVIFCQFSILFWLQHSAALTLAGTEALFLASIGLILLANRSAHFVAVLACFGAILSLSIALNTLFHYHETYDLFQGYWGNYGLWMLCGFACYRFPASWSWLLITICVSVSAGTSGLGQLLTTHQFRDSAPIILSLIAIGWFCWFCGMSRSRATAFMELHAVQEQLRREIAHTEELSATRERTRIARDVHDVLAHSLTILSIQVQAARQLVHSDPERLATKLDEMAVLLRESTMESRRVVGLLRAPETTIAPYHTIATHLRTIIESFSERSGIACLFAETGAAQAISAEQEKTLQFALQEALTNAHRHAGACTIWAELLWQEAQVTLQVRDNGQGQASEQSQNGVHNGHHGLQGMCERATAIGGEFQAHTHPDGGFMITLALPLNGLEQIVRR